MAYLGVHVTLHPVDSRRAKLAYKLGFSICAVSTVGLVVWQDIRNGRSQSALDEKIETASAQSTKANATIGELKQREEAEIARREQAEKDLAILVQASGKATRDGVVSDIKKTPISVVLNTKGENSEPLRIPNITMTPETVVSTVSDAKFCQRLVFQSDVTVDPVAMAIHLSEPVKYAGILLTEAYTGGAEISKSDPKRIDLVAHGMGMGILRPSNPLVLTVCGETSFKVSKFERVPFR
jgi:hypothetical protein